MPQSARDKMTCQLAVLYCDSRVGGTLLTHHSVWVPVDFNVDFNEV